MVVLALMLIGIAEAGVASESVAAARAALVSGDTDRARMLLMQARAAMPNESEIVDAALVADVLYFEGLTPKIMGVDREEDIDRFRDALSVYPQQKWARDVWDDKALRGYFEALRSEVLQRDPVPTGVPELRGLAEAYVDGVEHGPMQAVRSGPHVAQVKCPDGQITGLWTRFEEEIDWIRLCDERFDLTAQAPDQEIDEFDLTAPDPRAGPEPLAWVPPVRVKRVRRPVRITKKTFWVSAGAAGAIAVGTYAAALMSRSRYDNTASDRIRAPGELASQRSKTNTLVGVSVGATLVGGGLAAAAIWGGEF